MVMAPSAPVSEAVHGLPRLSRFLVDRPRLTAQLHAALGDGLCVVQAPAGFGKTTLLVQFAREIEYTTRWISLDAACASPEVLAHRIAAGALDSPSLGPPTAVRGAGDFKVYIREALVQAADASTTPLLLVLDNVSSLALTESSDAGAILDWLPGALPFGGELCLVSREPIHLPEIDRRVAGGTATLITRESLGFTRDEVAALLAKRAAPHNPSDILAATGGWPMAVAAIATGTARLPGHDLRPAGASAWRRYMARELWELVPGDIERLLLRLSIGETINADLAERMIGRESWVTLSNWLHEHDFLLDVLPGSRVQLNPMLRDFLQQHFEETDRNGFDAAVTLATDWCEGHGQIAEAFELARQLRSSGTLAGLVERNGRQLLYQGSFALLSRALATVRPAMFEDRPLLGAIRARVLAQQGEAEEALAQVNTVLRHTGGDAAARVLALLARLRVYRLLGRAEDYDGVFRQIRTVPGWDDDPSLAAEVAFAEGDLQLFGLADFDGSEEHFRECINQARAAGWVTLELLARSSLGQLQAMRGDGPAAVAELSKAAQGWRRVPGTSNLGWVLNNLGMAHLMVGDFDGAVKALEQAVEEGRACENLRNEAYAIASLAEAEAGAGRYDDARAHYSRAIELCTSTVRDERLVSLSLAGLANALLAQGDLQQADYLLGRARVVAESAGARMELGVVQMNDAVARVAAGRPELGLSLAIASEANFSDSSARPLLMLARFVLSYCQFSAGKRRDALHSLRVMQDMIAEPWQAGVLIPFIRQQPMFAQWAAAQSSVSLAFQETVARHVHRAERPARPLRSLPRVFVRSLGPVAVSMDGAEVPEEAWASARAKELFFVLLANPDGIRKEEAVELLYPDLSPEKCNSAFHSNIYRVRKALYPECVVKKGGAYLLNPEGSFDWDVREFERAIEHAGELPVGSDDRAAEFERAVAMYRGPFASTFYSEWADSMRRRLEDRSSEALVTLAGFHAGNRSYEKAADCLQQVMDRDHYNADVAYDLALYRARAGHPMRALTAIDECRRAHEQDLGIAIPSRMRELRSLIASGAAV